MRYKNIKLAVILLGVVLLISNDCMANERQKPVLSRGTLNVVLANEHCIVAATDSRATLTDASGNHVGYSDAAQKLFHVTDKIGCTIAAFGSFYFDGNRLGISAAGIINDYTRQVRMQNYIPSVEDVAGQLSFLFESWFDKYAEGKILAGEKLEDNYFEFYLTVFGFNNDKVPKLYQVKLTNKGTKIETINAQPISRGSLTIFLAGVSLLANDMLNCPQKYLEIPIIHKSTNMKNQPFEIDEMKELASLFIEQSSKVFNGIGGPIQWVALKDGEAVKWEINEVAVPPPWNFLVFKGNQFCDGLRGDGAEICANNWFTGGTVDLDNKYFCNNRFEDCTFYYRGGPVLLANNNIITRTRLLVGYEARNLPMAEYLRKNFSWESTSIEIPKEGPIR